MPQKFSFTHWLIAMVVAFFGFGVVRFIFIPIVILIFTQLNQQLAQPWAGILASSSIMVVLGVIVLFLKHTLELRFQLTTSIFFGIAAGWLAQFVLSFVALLF